MAKRSDTGFPTGLHAQLIAEILADFPDAKTKGFMAAIRSIPDAPYIQDMHRHDRRWWRLCNCIPDAFLIDQENREVVVFEVVVAHDVSQHKFGKFAELGWALDEDYYDLVLMRCDRFGRTRYLPREASVVNTLENRARDPNRDIVYVDDWHRYTAAYCAPKMPAILA